MVRTRPSSSPAPAFREGINVLFAGTEEIQKIQALILAGLANAEQRQVCLGAVHRGSSGHYFPQHRKCFDRMFRVVVVPGHSIVRQERKQLVSVPLQSLFAL